MVKMRRHGEGPSGKDEKRKVKEQEQTQFGSAQAAERRYSKDETPNQTNKSTFLGKEPQDKLRRKWILVSTNNDSVVSVNGLQ